MAMNWGNVQEMEHQITGFQQEQIGLERVDYAIFFLSSAIRKKGEGKRGWFPHRQEVIDTEPCIKKETDFLEFLANF